MHAATPPCEAALGLNVSTCAHLTRSPRVPCLPAPLPRDNIASRKLPAALCIANLANNPQLRVKLVRYKAYQLFVDMVG